VNENENKIHAGDPATQVNSPFNTSPAGGDGRHDGASNSNLLEWIE